MTELTTNEVFGPTIQGEGPSTGRRCGFIRLSRCNLSCSWCDTPYTWDWKGKNGVAYDPKQELHRTPVEELVSAVVAMDVPLVVISGGEPCIQTTGLGLLIDALLTAGLAVEVETNGTLFPPPWPTGAPELRYNVSPKLAHSGDPESQRIVLPVLTRFSTLPDTAFKFVAAAPSDLDEVEAIVVGAGIDPGQVWIMPEGTTGEAVAARLPDLGDAVVARGWNLTTRLHSQVWGNRRGV